MKPIQYQPPNYQQLPGLSAPISIREFKGLNTFDPLSIDDSFFTEMINMTSADYPTISTRPGYSVIGSFGSRVLGMGVWEGKELHVVFNDGTWRRWKNSIWTTLASGLDTTAEWTFTNFQGTFDQVNLIGCNGVNPMKRYDGSTISDLSGAPSNGKYITTYQNRLWCAVGVELWSCKLDNATVWDSFLNDDASYRKTMESNRGEEINMLTGSLTKLTIGMPNGLHELYGGRPSDFNTRLITEDTGLASNKAQTTLDGVMRFVHDTGIYEYGGGVSPEKSFSEIVGKLLTDIKEQSVAGTDGTRVLFNLVNGMSNDKMLVYDSRSGIQSWCLWRGIQAVQFASVGSDFFIGDALGRVLKLGGSTDGGVNIGWEAISKPFNGGSLAQKMRWYKLWVVVELSGSMQIDLSPSITGDDWVRVQDIAGTGTQVKRIIIPVAEFARENWIRVRFLGTGYVKIHEFTRQTRQLPLY
ncbi:hypothetical protein D3C76_262860 [compost metagenome]